MSTNTILASAPLTSTGYHLKANGTTLGNSLIWDNGTNVGIGNQGTTYSLDVTGSLRNTTSAYFATTSGTVGIGTTSATSPLSIYYPSTSAEVNYIKMEMPSWGGSVDFKKNIIWHDSGAIVGAIGMSFASSQTYMDFHSFYNTAHTTTTLMRIQGNGNVVIGSTTANAKLDVASTYVSDTTTQVMFRDNTGGGLLFGGTGGAVKWLQAQDYTGAATYYNLLLNPRGGSIGIGSTTVYNGGGFQKVISFYSPSSLALTYVTDTQQYQVGIASNDYRVYDFTGSTYRFVIKGTTGNVVIGDTTDNGQKLQVNGTTQSNGFQSYKGSISIGASATSTIYTMTSDGVYYVYCRLNGGSAIYMASAIVSSLASNGEAFISNTRTGSNVALTVSGSTIRITNGGFSTFTWQWSILYQPVD